MLQTPRPVSSVPCVGGTTLRRLALRIGVTAGLAAGLALPVVAVAHPASAARSSETVQDAAPQAAVEPVEGACGVRVTLTAGVGPRTVAVTARTVDVAVDAPVGAPVAPAATAGREVVVEDGGRWSAVAGASRAFALDLAGEPGEIVSRVEVTIRVDGGAPEVSLFVADCRSGTIATLTAVPSTTSAGTPAPGPIADAPPTGSTGPTGTPTAGARSGATDTAAGTSAPRPVRGVGVPVRTDAGGASSRRTAATPVPGRTVPGAVRGGSDSSGAATPGEVPLALPDVASPLSAPVPGTGVAQLPALSAPGPGLALQPVTGPLPQLAPPVGLFPPALVPSDADRQEQVAFQGGRPAPSTDPVADLISSGTALGLCMLALRGMVGRRRA